MGQLEFLVKGSAKDPYEVIFIKDGENLTAICTCPAGTYGNVCKHRTAIIDGDAGSVVSENAAEVETIVTWVVGTDVEVAMRALREAEAAGSGSTDIVKEAKANLAKAFND